MNLYIEKKLNLRLVFWHIFCQRILRSVVNFYLLVSILKKQKREGSRAGRVGEERKK